MCRNGAQEFVVHLGISAGRDKPLAGQASVRSFQLRDLPQRTAQQGPAVDGQPSDVVDVGVGQFQRQQTGAGVRQW